MALVPKVPPSAVKVVEPPGHTVVFPEIPVGAVDNAFTVIKESKIDTIILKPGIFGGFLHTVKLIRISNELHKKVIISSSFESAVGKSGLVMLASLTNHKLAHGLSTAEYYETNTCNDAFPVKNGIISFVPRIN